MRGGAARNLGTRHGSGSWLAFLDDDDYWTSDKLDLQMEAALSLSAAGSIPVIGCRVEMRYSEVSNRTTWAPTNLINPKQSITDYLFFRRRPGAGRSSFPTSTMLLPMDCARNVGWREGLERHQDWDYLIRLSAVQGVVLRQVPEALVVYNVGSSGSVSATSDWEASLKWAVEVLSGASPRIFSEFLVAQPLRYAFQARSLVGVGRVLKCLVDARRIPSLQSGIVGLSGLLSRRQLEKAMSVFR